MSNQVSNAIIYDANGRLIADPLLNVAAGTVPGGSDTQVQYNSMGSFAGASGLTTDGTNLTAVGNIITNAITSVGSSAALIISGANRAQGIQLTDASNSPVINVDTLNHRIGINVSSPVTSLELNGSAKFGSTLEVNPAAILTLGSTTQGFLPPRMTTTQKNAISSPNEGLVVYDKTLHKLSVFTGTVWETVTSS